MRTRLLLCLAAAGLAAAGGAATSLASGIAPGFAQDGILGPSGHVRYVAVSTQRTTKVEAVRAGSGKVMRSATLKGVYGVPAVTYDGTAGGLTRDARTLVLSTFPGAARNTRFLVVDTRTLRVRSSIPLAGYWSFDALSPDGTTMYLIQFSPGAKEIHYLVRAYDLKARRLVEGAIADKSEPGPMTGRPMSRAVTADGTWAYTLYDRGDGRSAFVHALNTVARVAICVDVDLPAGAFGSGQLHLVLSPDERQLLVRGPDGTTLKTVSAPR